MKSFGHTDENSYSTTLNEKLFFSLGRFIREMVDEININDNDSTDCVKLHVSLKMIEQSELKEAILQ